MLMWSHYSNHSGFVAVFDVSKLEKQFHGPFPINYVERADSFNINKDPHLSVLYLTNIKSKCWSYEKEWRLLIESSESMQLPNRNDFPDLSKRKAYYSKDSLKEIILGFNFFHYNSYIEKMNDYDIFDFDIIPENENRTKLIDYLIKFNIPVSLIHINNNLEFKLSKRNIIVAKFENNKYGFKIKNVA